MESEERRPASKIVLASGGFDPVHVGHIRYLRDAASYGKLYIALNSDEWLIRKKGYCVMTWADRAEILEALSFVTCIVKVDDSDGTVCDAIMRVRPKWFANGGDRIVADPREHVACEKLNVSQLFHVGGEKIRSSSLLVQNPLRVVK